MSGGEGARQIAALHESSIAASALRASGKLKGKGRDEVLRPISEAVAELQATVNCETLGDVIGFFGSKHGYVGKFEWSMIQQLSHCGSSAVLQDLAEPGFCQYHASLGKWAEPRIALEELCGHGLDAKYCSMQRGGNGVEHYGAVCVVLRSDVLNGAVYFRGDSGWLLKSLWPTGGGGALTSDDIDAMFDDLRCRFGTSSSLQHLLTVGVMEHMKHAPRNQKRRGTMLVDQVLRGKYGMIEAHIHRPITWHDIAEVHVVEAFAEHLDTSYEAYLAARSSAASPKASPKPRMPAAGAMRNLTDLGRVWRLAQASPRPLRIYPERLERIAKEIPDDPP